MVLRRRDHPGVSRAGCLALGAPSPAAERPNVLFIAIDDMNDYVSCLGGYRGEFATPHIDRLAERGMLFTNAHCAAPLCNPSRTALLTGRAPSRTGCYSNSPFWREAVPDAVVFPAYFREHGSRVEGGGKIFHTGKKHHPHDVWDHFVDQVMDPEPEGYPLHGVDALRTNFDWGPFDKSDWEMGDGQIVRRGMQFLSREQDAPLFLAGGIFRPHLPFDTPRECFDQHALDGSRLPLAPSDDLDDVPQAALKLGEWKLYYYDAISALNRMDEVIQGYLASCAFADALVGELVGALDRSAYADDTIIVLFSDHGWHLGEKFKVNKHTLWEEATRVPLIVIAPGVTRAGTRSAEAVSLLDLHPTLMELCDLPPRTDRARLEIYAQAREPEFTGGEWSPRWFDYDRLPSSELRALKREVHDHDLTICGVTLNRFLLTGCPEAGRHFERLMDSIRVAREWKAESVIVSLSMPQPPSLERPMRMGQDFADGVRLVLELHEEGLLDTPERRLRMQQAVGGSNVRINPDLGNLVRHSASRDAWRDAIEQLAPQAGYWHVKNYRDGRPAPWETATLTTARCSPSCAAPGTRAGSASKATPAGTVFLGSSSRVCNG